MLEFQDHGCGTSVPTRYGIITAQLYLLCSIISQNILMGYEMEKPAAIPSIFEDDPFDTLQYFRSYIILCDHGSGSGKIRDCYGVCIIYVYDCIHEAFGT